MQGTVDAQLQLKIHQILNGCGFYRLPLLRLSAILRLLGAEEARYAKAIQANTITGLIRLTNSLRYCLYDAGRSSRTIFLRESFLPRRWRCRSICRGLYERSLPSAIPRAVSR